MSYKIITDSSADLSQTMLDSLQVDLVNLQLNYKDRAQPGSQVDLPGFYEDLKNGATASTSAANPTDWKQAMHTHLSQGLDVLVLAFSSGLSTTYQSAVIAADELSAEFPQRQIRVIDTLCASLGQGMLVYLAAQKQLSGASFQEVAEWCQWAVPHLSHWFTVDDLMYLKRGGRVSAATALLGTALGIKPVLHVDDEGHLINVSKVRGRKASILALASKFDELCLPEYRELAWICHGNCLADAQLLEKELKEKHGVKEVYIDYTGAVIGSHSGPGTLALFFLGQKR